MSVRQKGNRWYVFARFGGRQVLVAKFDSENEAREYNAKLHPSKRGLASKIQDYLSAAGDCTYNTKKSPPQGIHRG